jgi:outer membrane protein assembly factor BamB
VRDWKRVQVKKLWKQDTPKGFSSFAVAGGKAFTIIMDEVDGNTTEVLVALDVKSGKKAWSAPLTVISKYTGGGDSGTPDNKGGDGPRSTPVVDGSLVYAIDANLGVFCFDAATGKAVWNRDVLKDHAGVQIKWENAASPLIDGDVLMLCGGGPGQALLGLNKTTGEVIWKGEDDKMTHATPILADIHGVHQAIFFTQTGLVGVTPATGKVLWNERLGGGFSASPVLAEGRIVFVNEEGAATVVRAAPVFEVLARNDLGERTLASPATTDNALYLRTESRLRRIGSAANR